jgi:hypothetical protein
MANAQTLAGKWTYRSFLNDPVQVTNDPDPNKVAQNLLALLFAEAVFTFEIRDDTTLKGVIDWDGGVQPNQQFVQQWGGAMPGMGGIPGMGAAMPGMATMPAAMPGMMPQAAGGSVDQLRAQVTANSGISVLGTDTGYATNAQIPLLTTNLPILQPGQGLVRRIIGTIPAPSTNPGPVLTNGVGYGAFGQLQEQVDTNWFTVDQAVLAFGVWPDLGGFGGPGLPERI